MAFGFGFAIPSVVSAIVARFALTGANITTQAADKLITESSVYLITE